MKHVEKSMELVRQGQFQGCFNAVKTASFEALRRALLWTLVVLKLFWTFWTGQVVKHADMVFVTCGMGGGTGEDHN